MNKKYLLIITTLTFATITAVWILRTPSLPTPSERLKAEKEIYSLLLVGPYFNEGIPIADFTTLGDLGYYGFSQEGFLDWDKKIPVLKRETFNNFVEINEQPYFIRDYLPMQTTSQLIEQQDWWVSLSRIGFDSQLNQALVVIERNMGCDNKGNCCVTLGSVVFLQNKFNQWAIIDDALSVWISECNA